MFLVAVVLALAGSAGAQTNNRQDFGYAGVYSSEAARTAGADLQWLNEGAPDLRLAFGFDEDEAGEDASCGGRPGIRLHPDPVLSACEGILTEAGVNNCLQALADLDEFHVYVVVSAPSFGSKFLFHPARLNVVFNMNHPEFANPVFRTTYIIGFVFENAYKYETGQGWPVNLNGTWIRTGVPGVVTEFQCSAWGARNWWDREFGEEDLPCHVPTVTRYAAQLPGYETECTLEGDGDTCDRGLCIGPPPA